MSYKDLINTELRVYGGCDCGCTDIATLNISRKKDLYLECFICGSSIKLGNIDKQQKDTMYKLKYLITTGTVVGEHFKYSKPVEKKHRLRTRIAGLFN